MISYRIDITCEYAACFAKASFTGRSFSDAVKSARRQGWWIHGEHAKCPTHKQTQSVARRKAHHATTSTRYAQH